MISFHNNKKQHNCFQQIRNDSPNRHTRIIQKTDHVTLKTGVMNAEQFSFPIMRINDIFKSNILINPKLLKRYFLNSNDTVYKN